MAFTNGTRRCGFPLRGCSRIQLVGALRGRASERSPMKTISKAGLGAVGALVLTLFQGSIAVADVQPQGADVVGVGSDTVQFGIDFLADGDVAGDAGFNATNQTRRAINFDATGDACGGVTAGATVVLRANSKPVGRPNGSGSGISALLTDTGATENINFVRSSRLPNATRSE